MHETGKGVKKLEEVYSEPLFIDILNVPTIFLYTDKDSESKVLEQMLERNNGLDLMTGKYVAIQNLIFKHLRGMVERDSRYTNFRFLEITRDTLYTSQVIKMAKDLVYQMKSDLF